MRKKLKQYLRVLLVLFIVFTASVPFSLFVGADKPDKPDKPEKPEKPEKPKKPEDKFAEFTLSYNAPDVDFGTIDFSGIEYYLDGVLQITPSENIVLFFNDALSHNFSLTFGEVLYEYIFSIDTTESILLNTKDIDATVVFADIGVEADLENVELWYLDGIDWISIETAITDENGLISFSSLIMGDYIICRVDAFVEANIFTLEQDTITYDAVIEIEAIKTTINIDYLISLTGETNVDLSLITWDFGLFGSSSQWIPLTNLPNDFDGMLFDNATGTIVIYNLEVCPLNSWYLKIDNYAGVAEETYVITKDVVNQIDFIAKSLEATFEWSYDNAPYVGITYDLFWFNGIDFEVIGTYITDELGMITIIEVLPIGLYKLGDNEEFNIVANDVIKTVVYTVESLSGKRTTLGFHWKLESKFFIFIITLILYHPSCRRNGFCLDTSPVSLLFLTLSRQLNLLYKRG